MFFINHYFKTTELTVHSSQYVLVGHFSSCLMPMKFPHPSQTPNNPDLILSIANSNSFISVSCLIAISQRKPGSILQRGCSASQVLQMNSSPLAMLMISSGSRYIIRKRNCMRFSIIFLKCLFKFVSVTALFFDIVFLNFTVSIFDNHVFTSFLTQVTQFQRMFLKHLFFA